MHVIPVTFWSRLENTAVVELSTNCQTDQQRTQSSVSTSRTIFERVRNREQVVVQILPEMRFMSNTICNHVSFDLLAQHVARQSKYWGQSTNLNMKLQNKNPSVEKRSIALNVNTYAFQKKSTFVLPIALLGKLSCLWLTLLLEHSSSGWAFKAVKGWSGLGANYINIFYLMFLTIINFAATPNTRSRVRQRSPKRFNCEASRQFHQKNRNFEQHFKKTYFSINIWSKHFHYITNKSIHKSTSTQEIAFQCHLYDVWRYAQEIRVKSHVFKSCYNERVWECRTDQFPPHYTPGFKPLDGNYTLYEGFT